MWFSLKPGPTSGLAMTGPLPLGKDRYCIPIAENAETGLSGTRLRDCGTSNTLPKPGWC
jgi:hypothetical protein